MAKAKSKFRVHLHSRDGSGPRELVVDGNQMEVNHRGDLLILESAASYGSHKALAVFKSGSWLEAFKIMEDAEPG